MISIDLVIVNIILSKLMTKPGITFIKVKMKIK